MHGGDFGITQTYQQTGISKSEPVFEAFGDLDELGAWLGYLRSCRLDVRYDEQLILIQKLLFDMGAYLAGAGTSLQIEITQLECWVDEIDSQLEPLKEFVIPGQNQVSSVAHICRTICRRAERHVVALENEVVTEQLVPLLNRMSTYLFSLARVLEITDG